MADNFVKLDPNDVFSEGNDLIGDLCRSIVADMDKQVSDEIAEVIKKHYKKYYPGLICDGEKVLRFARLLKAQGVPDMVEVVRCKDCKYWRKTKTDPILTIDYGECCCKNFWDIHLTTSKDFCSYGERKEG